MTSWFCIFVMNPARYRIFLRSRLRKPRCSCSSRSYPLRAASVFEIKASRNGGSRMHRAMIELTVAVLIQACLFESPRVLDPPHPKEHSQPWPRASYIPGSRPGPFLAPAPAATSEGLGREPGWHDCPSEYRPGSRHPRHALPRPARAEISLTLDTDRNRSFSTLCRSA